MEKHSTLFYSLLTIVFIVLAYICTAMSSIGMRVLNSLMVNNFNFPQWVHIYIYSYFILTSVIFIWSAWTKNINYALMYITVTAFLNLDIAYYFAPDYTSTALQKMFPFLYWIN